MLTFILVSIVTIICWCALSALVYYLLKAYDFAYDYDIIPALMIIFSPLGILILTGVGLGYVVYKKIDVPLNNIIDKIKKSGGS